MYSYGKRSYYSAGGSNSERNSNRQCDSMREHRECKRNRRRRFNTVYVCVEQRKDYGRYIDAFSGHIQCNSNGCEQLQRYGGCNNHSAECSNSERGSEQQYDSMCEHRQRHGNRRRRQDPIHLFMDRRQHSNHSHRLSGRELYGNGNGC